jgi:hypothetical protein
VISSREKSRPVAQTAVVAMSTATQKIVSIRASPVEARRQEIGLGRHFQEQKSTNALFVITRN